MLGGAKTSGAYSVRGYVVMEVVDQRQKTGGEESPSKLKTDLRELGRQI